MAELESGHHDELKEMLANWLRQASDPIGSLPEGTDSTEWAVRNFIDAWRRPVRDGVDSVEQSIKTALKALETGDVDTAKFELGCENQALAEDVRDNLGLYDWNHEGS